MATVPPTSVEVRSTWGASDVTVTLSVRPPTLSVISICAVAPTRSTTSFSSKVVKPGSVARTLYGPGTRDGTENDPSLPAIVSRTTPLSRWVTITVAPGSTAACSSSTRPRIEATP